MLSPLEIVGDAKDSYQANNTLGVTGTNREIKTLPLSMEAMTRTFIDDIAATELNGVLAFAANIQDIQNVAARPPLVAHYSDRCGKRSAVTSLL